MMAMDAQYIEMLNDLKRRISHLERVENAMAQNHGWIGSAWQKDPIVDGYSGDLAEEMVDTNASAGTDGLIGTAVPAGEIWIVQAVAARNDTSAVTSIQLNINNGVTTQPLTYVGATAAGVWLIWTGKITLSEGDDVRCTITGCTAGDDIRMRYHAVRVDIDQ